MAKQLAAKALREVFEANKAALTRMVLQQPKPADKAKMVLAFEDSNGLKYYGYHQKDLENMSVDRYSHITRLLGELNRGVSGDEMDKFIWEIDHAVRDGVIDGERVALVCHEYKIRKTWLYRPDLMFETACAILMREDENPFLWDDALHKEKILQLRKDVEAIGSGGVYDFFHKPTLKAWLPQLALSKTEYENYLTSIEERLKQWREITKNGLGLKKKKASTRSSKRAATTSRAGAKS